MRTRVSLPPRDLAMAPISVLVAKVSVSCVFLTGWRALTPMPMATTSPFARPFVQVDDVNAMLIRSTTHLVSSLTENRRD